LDLNDWMVGLGLYIGSYHLKEINEDYCIITDVAPDEEDKKCTMFEMKIWFGRNEESQKLKRILYTLRDVDPERCVGLKYEIEVAGRIISRSPGLGEVSYGE